MALFNFLAEMDMVIKKVTAQGDRAKHMRRVSRWWQSQQDNSFQGVSNTCRRLLHKGQMMCTRVPGAPAMNTSKKVLQFMTDTGASRGVNLRG